MDVIVHALNPPYPAWSKAMPVLTANVITAASQCGATVMIPGNVYNFGEAMPAVLSESTAHAPTTRKGRLREQMEKAFAASNVQTIVLRAGDFIDAEQSGNWFDGHIANKVSKGSIMYPGPTDQRTNPMHGHTCQTRPMRWLALQRYEARCPNSIHSGLRAIRSQAIN